MAVVLVRALQAEMHEVKSAEVAFLVRDSLSFKRLNFHSHSSFDNSTAPTI